MLVRERTNKATLAEAIGADSDKLHPHSRQLLYHFIDAARHLNRWNTGNKPKFKRVKDALNTVFVRLVHDKPGDYGSIKDAYKHALNHARDWCSQHKTRMHRTERRHGRRMPHRFKAMNGNRY